MDNIRHTPDEWAQILGKRVQAHRLSIEPGMTQQALAEKAGVSLATLKRIEEGRPTSMLTFFSVVMALGLAGWLKQFPEVDTFSPLTFVESGAGQRQRARTSRQRGK